MLGNAALQINLVVNSNLASGITDAAGHVIDGPVSWLGYAFRFMQLPVGLFGVAIASATLPAISRSAGLRRMDEFRDHAGALAGHHPAADHSFLGGTGGDGREHDRRGVPGRPVHGLRYPPDGAGAHLLQRRAWPDIRPSRRWRPPSMRWTMRARPCW